LYGRNAKFSLLLQTRVVELALESLQSGNDPSLPPLMNPKMLEASDDLTNLSHLNEPAGNENPEPLQFTS
jgi:hypothetical protein